MVRLITPQLGSRSTRYRPQLNVLEDRLAPTAMFKVTTPADSLDAGDGRLSLRVQNNGGPSLTHALLRGSPAIDAGDNTDAPATDQRRRGPAQGRRPRPQPARRYRALEK